MKKILSAIFLAILFFASIPCFAKVESGSLDADSTVLYGKNGSTLVPIQVDSNGKIATSGGGGGGTPGGTNPQLQYNNSGSFGGVSASGTDSNGNVGLGTSIPSEKLDLYNGNIVFSQVKSPTAPTVAVGAAGVLTGTYEYCVSYYNATGQTRCTVSATVSPSSQQVTVTIPVSAQAGVTGRKIYRTLANATSNATGQIIAYLVTTIADNSTVSYSDNTADTTIQANTQPVWSTSTASKIYNNDNNGGGNNGHILVGFFGRDDLALGYQAGLGYGSDTVTGWQNTLVGGHVGQALTAGIRNTMGGYNSGLNIQNGNFNAGWGTWTLQGLVSGADNAAFDHGSLENVAQATNNSAYGFYSLYSLGMKESGSSFGGRQAMGQAINTFNDYSGTVAGTVRAHTTSAHPYQTGDIVRVGGTQNYDGVYTVTSIDSNNFYFTATYISAETNVGESTFSGATVVSGLNNADDINDNIAMGYYASQKMAWGQNNTFLGTRAHYENGSIGDALSYSGCLGSDCQVNIDNAFAIGSDKTASSTYFGYVNLGLNVRRPIYDLTMNGTKAAQTIGVNRNLTTAGAAGNSLSIRAGGATVNGSISALNKTPTAGGTGYTLGDILTITTGGSGGTAKVVDINQGAVTIVAMLNEGSGYTTGSSKATSGGTGTGCTLNITTVRASTDLNGGDLNIYSGIGVGTGTSKMAFFTNPAGSTGTTDTTPTEAMRITSGGNVGIGSINPRGAVDVGSGSYWGDGSHLTGISGAISGLTTGKLPQAASATTLSDSVIVQSSNNIGISVTPVNKLDVSGAAAIGTYAGTNAAPANGLIVSGSVGIGTTNPQVGFEIAGKTFRMDSTNAIGWGTDGNVAFQTDAATSGNLLMKVGGNTREFLGTNVGIGTTIPGSKLGVGGGIAVGLTYASQAAPTGGAIIQGNVGIGSLTPGQALDVQGTIRGLSGGTCTTLYTCNGGVDVGVIQSASCSLCPGGSCVAMNGCF